MVYGVIGGGVIVDVADVEVAGGVDDVMYVLHVLLLMVVVMQLALQVHQCCNMCLFLSMLSFPRCIRNYLGYFIIINAY